MFILLGNKGAKLGKGRLKTSDCKIYHPIVITCDAEVRQESGSWQKHTGQRHFSRLILKLLFHFQMKGFSQEKFSGLVPWSKAHD